MPAPLTITADDKSRDAGQPNPPLTASYAGFVAGETAAVLGGTLSLTTAADAGSPAGLYSIVPSGQSSQNYAIRYVNGTLTVLLAPVAAAAVVGGRRRAGAARRAPARSQPRPRRQRPAATASRPPRTSASVPAGRVCQVARPVCEARPALTLGR